MFNILQLKSVNWFWIQKSFNTNIFYHVLLYELTTHPYKFKGLLLRKLGFTR